MWSHLSDISVISWMTVELFWKSLPLAICWNIFSSVSSNCFWKWRFYLKVYKSHVAFDFLVSYGFALRFVVWVHYYSFSGSVFTVKEGLGCYSAEVAFVFSAGLGSISVDHMHGTPCQILTCDFKSRILYMNIITINLDAHYESTARVN